MDDQRISRSMPLMISSVPYAQWQALCPVLCQSGYLLDPEGTGQFEPPEQLEQMATDQSSRVLFFIRPELAVARAVEAGECAPKALSLWEFAAGLLVRYYKRHRRQTVLVDLELALAQPEKFLAALAAHGPSFARKAAPASGAGEELGPQSFSPTALMVATALVAQSKALKPLVEQLSSFSLFIDARYEAPEIDFSAVQASLPLDSTQPPPAAQEAPDWLLRQMFHAQEQLNHYYLREESAHAELGQARDALARLQVRNAQLKKQVDALQRNGAPGHGVQWLDKAVRWLKSALGGGLVRRYRLRQQVALVLSSGYFDEAWYLAHNPDVKQAGMDPAWHFVGHGGQEGRAPGPRFDALRYLTRNPDVAEAGVNPLVHYLTQGKEEGRPL